MVRSVRGFLVVTHDGQIREKKRARHTRPAHWLMIVSTAGRCWRKTNAPAEKCVLDMVVADNAVVSPDANEQVACCVMLDWLRLFEHNHSSIIANPSDLSAVFASLVFFNCFNLDFVFLKFSL